MATYILESSHAAHHAHTLPHSVIKDMHDFLEQGHAEGRILAAYSKVGGGQVYIVEAESNRALYRRLRELGVHGLTVTPVVEMRQVLRAYDEHHASQAEGSSGE